MFSTKISLCDRAPKATVQDSANVAALQVLQDGRNVTTARSNVAADSQSCLLSRDTPGCKSLPFASAALTFYKAVLRSDQADLRSIEASLKKAGSKGVPVTLG